MERNMRSFLGWVWSVGFFLMVVSGSSAKEQESVLKIKNKIPYISEETQTFETSLDENLMSWYLSDLIESDSAIVSSGVDVYVPDSVYVKRLEMLSEMSTIEFPFNSKVKNFIKLYTSKRRSLTQNILGLSSYYFPIFEEELNRQNMPMELKYLPVIESALNPRAFSKAGASGLWQFIYSTGRFYKLDINTYVDQRNDPYESTIKAVKYLKDLYAIYNDWFLVIAAYNCGPGNVNKAIRRSGGKRDYWEIYYRLPRETRGYVPAFISAAYTMNYHAEHNLYATACDLPQHVDTIMVAEPLHLKQVSEVLDISIDLVRDLNPQYRIDYIPAGTEKYPLVLPTEYTFAFIDREDAIFAHKKEELHAVKRTRVEASNSRYVPSAPANKTKLYYTVKSGDNLGFIAEWYDVGLSSLRSWNGIYKNTIRVGQKIVVYVPNNKSEYYREVNSMSFAKKQARNGKPARTNVVSTKSSTTPAALSGDFEYYKVRSGDNLYSIAKRYPGISAQNIMDMNNMKSSSLQVGMLLKIKPKNG